MLSTCCLLDPPPAVHATATPVPAMAGGLAWSAASGYHRVKLASEPWEIARYWQVRQSVFCDEQGLFNDSDADEHDAHAHPIVAVSYNAVMDDDVVGTVRIYEQSPGVWWGSRLAVEPEWRGVRSLAAGLIRCAVTTAHARGCHTFLATVQRQNVPLFRRLHWSTLSEVEVCGKPHHLMRADLSHYPAHVGDVSTAGQRVANVPRPAALPVSPVLFSRPTLCAYLEAS